MVASGVNFFAPQIEDLVHWGGNFKPLVLSGQWWRLFTCMFLHSGIIHIAFNMYALLFIGIYLEPLLGRLRFATAYLATGLLSSVTSAWWHGDNIVGVGASGAIFGLYGVFLALLTTSIIHKRARQSLLTSVVVFAGYTLLYGFSHKEVDNAAHIGGLISGLVIGYVFYFSFKYASDKKTRKISVAIAGGALLIILAYMGTGRLNDDYRFEQQYARFITIEATALAPLQFDNKDNFNIPELEEQLRETSMPAWKKAQQLIDSTNAFHLSPAYARKRQLMAEYVQLRIQHTALLVEMFNSPGGDVMEKYKEPVLALKAKISEVQKEMVGR